MIKKSIKTLCDGFIDGGIDNVINFPGFFSHEIFDNLNGDRISLNERVAFDISYGISLSGKRSLLTIKNIGLNVASDPFLHSLLSGVNGGMVIVITEDVDVVASQERQDSRHYHDFFGGMWFEPNSLNSAYNIARQSFYLSEKYDTPVVIRLTNNFFNLIDDYKKLNKIKLDRIKISKNSNKYIIYPNYWLEQKKRLDQKNIEIDNFVDKFINYIPYKKSKLGLIAVGASLEEPYSKKYKYWDKLFIETYPIPKKTIQKFINKKNEVVVLEQGDDLVFKKIENLIQNKNKNLVLKSKIKIISDESKNWIVWDNLSKLFKAIKSIKPSFVVGDVGQFTVESTHVIDSCLCLGSSVGNGIGLVLGGVQYPFCITGDASFLHSGIQALSEAVSRKIAMGIIVIDNNGSVSTGGQKLISSVYNINKKIDKIEIDYNKVSLQEIKNVLIKMRNSNKLMILYVKI
jgi:indolepyruvate ferredoxin oxidoreductase, alpha subunit